MFVNGNFDNISNKEVTGRYWFEEYVFVFFVFFRVYIFFLLISLRKFKELFSKSLGEKTWLVFFYPFHVYHEGQCKGR